MSLTHVGGMNPNQAAGNELRRRQRERFAKTSGWPELDRKDLRPERFSIRHEPTDTEYRIYAGEIDLGPSHPIDAYYVDREGGIVFLEKLGSR